MWWDGTIGQTSPKAFRMSNFETMSESFYVLRFLLLFIAFGGMITGGFDRYGQIYTLTLAYLIIYYLTISNVYTIFEFPLTYR